MQGLGLGGLGRNIGATFMRQIIAALFNLLTVVLIARVYGPEGNGAFAVALLLPSILSSFLNLGVAPANVYHLGTNQVSVQDLLRANLRIFVWMASIGLAAGSAVLLTSSEKIFPGVSALHLWFALAIFPISLLTSYLGSFFQGLQMFKPFNLLMILQPAVLLLLASGLTASGNRELGFLIGAQFASQFLVMVLTMRWVVSLTGAPEAETTPTDFRKKTLSYGWKAHLSNILAFVNYKADLFLVNLFMSPAAAGVYLIAVAIVEKLWLLSQAVSTVLLPRLAQLSSDENKRKKITPLIARWVLAITLLAALILALVAQWLIGSIFGSEYSSALVPLWILLPGIVLTAASRVLANDIAARGKPELNMYTSILVVLTNVICNVLLIPKYGLNGAAGATTIAYILNLILRLVVHGHLTGVRWYDSVFVTADDVRMICSFLNGKG